MAKEFIINDESVLNDQGFRVLTDGIRISNFEKNPLGLFMHRRPYKWDLTKDSVLPICQWTNLRKEGGKLYGTPVFDEKDEFAVKIMQKVEDGFLRMCSMGANPITTSSDEQYLLPGQRYETVVECELLEVSIVDLSSNPNTIALYQADEEGAMVMLASNTISQVLPVISKETETNPVSNMKNIAIKLGLAESATEDMILKAISDLQSSESALKTKVEGVELSAISGIVDTAIKEKRFTADKRDQMIQLGKTAGVEALRSTVELMRPVGKPTDHIEGGSGSEGSEPETMITLMKKGAKAMEEFRSENPQKYAELYKEHYGFEYVSESDK